MIKITPLILSYYLADIIAKNIASYKLPKHTYDEILFTPKEKENVTVDENFDINSLNFGKYTKIVKRFNNKLEKYFTPEELALLHNNLKTMEIKKRPYLIYLITRREGKYLLSDNKIVLYSLDPSVLTHELFHTAGCFSIENDEYLYIASGLRKYYIIFGDKIVTVGKGINEGYTELLNSRYQKGQKDVYREQKKIAKALEIIIGQYQMEGDYLKADLNDVVETLASYSTEEDTEDFIYKTDLDIKYILIPLLRRPKLRKEIRDYLVRCYANKLLTEYKNYRISKEELEYELLNYACFLNKKFLFKDMFSTEYFAQILKDTLNETLFDEEKGHSKTKKQR